MIKILLLILFAIPCYGGNFNDNGVNMADNTDANLYRSNVSSPAFAVQAWNINLTSITTINTAETFEVLCGTSALIAGSFFRMAADVNGNNNRLTFQKAGYYLLSYAGCHRDTTASASTARITIYKNGAPLSNIRSNYYPVQDKLETLAVSYAGYFSVNDYVEIMLTSDDADDYNICTSELVVVKIG